MCIAGPLAFHFGVHVNRLEQPHCLCEKYGSCALSRTAGAARDGCHIHIIPVFHCTFSVCICRQATDMEKSLGEGQYFSAPPLLSPNQGKGKSGQSHY